MPRTLTHDQDEAVRLTYFSLRYGMVALAGMLYLGVLYQVARGCSEGSISAYYFTPVRPVLIAALGAIGAGLIIHHGNGPKENRILDAAGFSAIIVAFVPTQLPSPKPTCDAAQIPEAYHTGLDADVTSTAVASVAALAITAVVVLLVARYVLTPPTADPQARATTDPPAKWIPDRSVTAGLSVSVLLVLGVVLYVLLGPESFRTVAHPLAAIIFFALILTVMWSNGRDPDTPERFRKRYQRTVYVTLGLMAVSCALALVLDWWLFCLETVGILGFMYFWWTQSRELGGAIDRRASSN